MSTPANPYDTAIYVRVKRYNHTFFILCDEYEEIAAFKNRVLAIIEQENLVKSDEKLTIDDIKLCLRNRVILHHNIHL